MDPTTRDSNEHFFNHGICPALFLFHDVAVIYLPENR